MKKVKDLVVKVREYEVNGEKKAEWLNIGVVMENENGQFLLINRTFNPAGLLNPDGKTSVMVSMFEPQDRSGQAKPAQENPTLDDPLPF